MAALTVQVPSSTGLAAVYGLTQTGDQVPAGTGVVLHARNTTGAAHTVTLVTPQLIDGDLAVADRVVSIPATTGQRFIAVPDLYRDPATGLCLLTYDVVATAGFDIACLRVN